MRIHQRHKAFTLVELLVVIGIIGVLMAILLPSLRSARLKGQQVVCQSNLKQLFLQMQMYCNVNKGYMFPVGPPVAPSRYASTLGTQKMPHERWPVILFQIKVGELAYENNESKYQSSNPNSSSDPVAVEAFMKAYDATPFTPKVLLCPSDLDPYEAHSYVVNQELVQNDNPVRFAGGNRGGRSSSEIIVAGEKRRLVRDYHMERAANTRTDNKPITDFYGTVYASDFDRVVEPYRHGLSYGSNYLFLDGHVATQLPEMSKTQVDPSDVPHSTNTD